MSALITTEVRPLAALLRESGVVIFPTETVYGMGASALDPFALDKVYRLKGRPRDNPLIAHFPSIASITKYCYLTKEAEMLLEAFSPGPLAVILKKRRELAPFGLPTVGVRIPDHKATLRLFEEVGLPISAPSANLSGRPSLTRLEHVMESFSKQVDGILLGEDPKIGIESTVVDLSGETPRLLRPGFIEEEDIRFLLPNLEVWQSNGKETEAPPSPGMKYRHYAPKAKVILVGKQEFSTVLQLEDPSVAYLGTLPAKDLLRLRDAKRIFASVSSNLHYMREMFAFFEFCDNRGIQTIYCEIPELGRGFAALENRLLKASEGKKGSLSP